MAVKLSPILAHAEEVCLQARKRGLAGFECVSGKGFSSGYERHSLWVIIQGKDGKTSGRYVAGSGWQPEGLSLDTVRVMQAELALIGLDALELTVKNANSQG